MSIDKTANIKPANNELIDSYLASQNSSLVGNYIQSEAGDYITSGIMSATGGGIVYTAANLVTKEATGNTISDYKDKAISSVTETKIDNNGKTLIDYFQDAMSGLISMISDLMGGDHAKTTGVMEAYAKENKDSILREFDKTFAALPDELSDKNKAEIKDIVGQSLATGIKNSKGSFKDNVKDVFSNMTSDNTKTEIREAADAIGQNVGAHVYSETLNNVTEYLVKQGDMGYDEAKHIAAGIAGSVAGGTLTKVTDDKGKQTGEVVFVTNKENPSGMSAITAQTSYNIKIGQENTMAGVGLNLLTPKYNDSLSTDISSHRTTTSKIKELTAGNETAADQVAKIRSNCSGDFDIADIKDGESFDTQCTIGNKKDIETIGLSQ